MGYNNSDYGNTSQRIIPCSHRYQHRCDELEVANAEYVDKYDQMDQDKKAIVSYLKKNLEQRG